MTTSYSAHTVELFLVLSLGIFREVALGAAAANFSLKLWLNFSGKLSKNSTRDFRILKRESNGLCLP